MPLEELKERLRDINRKKLHERDTIERFIVPVIECAEWDIYSINPMILKRGNRDTRSKNRRFDIELYCQGNDKPRFVFECKRISRDIKIFGKGNSQNIHDSTDFLRQLKNDCLSNHFPFQQGWTIPVLTNGDKWIIFKSKFTDISYKDEKVTEENYTDFILSKVSLADTDFEEKIVNFIKSKKNAEQAHRR